MCQMFKTGSRRQGKVGLSSGNENYFLGSWINTVGSELMLSSQSAMYASGKIREKIKFFFLIVYQSEKCANVLLGMVYENVLSKQMSVNSTTSFSETTKWSI